MESDEERNGRAQCAYIPNATGQSYPLLLDRLSRCICDEEVKERYLLGSPLIKRLLYFHNSDANRH